MLHLFCFDTVIWSLSFRARKISTNAFPLVFNCLFVS